RLRDEQGSPAGAVERLEVVASGKAADAVGGELGVRVEVVRDDRQGAIHVIGAEDPVGAFEGPAIAGSRGAGGDQQGKRGERGESTGEHGGGRSAGQAALLATYRAKSRI